MLHTSTASEERLQTVGVGSAQKHAYYYYFTDMLCSITVTNQSERYSSAPFLITANVRHTKQAHLIYRVSAAESAFDAQLIGNASQIEPSCICLIIAQCLVPCPIMCSVMSTFVVS